MVFPKMGKKLQYLLFLYNSTLTNRLSYKERRENDLASRADEGRDKLR